MILQSLSLALELSEFPDLTEMVNEEAQHSEIQIENNLNRKNEFEFILNFNKVNFPEIELNSSSCLFLGGLL